MNGFSLPSTRPLTREVESTLPRVYNTEGKPLLALVGKAGMTHFFFQCCVERAFNTKQNCLTVIENVIKMSFITTSIMMFYIENILKYVACLVVFQRERDQT